MSQPRIQIYDVKQLADMYTENMEVKPPKSIREIRRRATKMLISLLRNEENRELITLQELYQGLNAQSEYEGKNDVRWGVRFAKDINMIRKTDKRGIYAVC